MVAAATGNDNRVSKKMFKTNRNLNGLKGSKVLQNKIRHVELQRSISPACVQQEVCVSDSLNTLNSKPAAVSLICDWSVGAGEGRSDRW